MKKMSLLLYALFFSLSLTSYAQSYVKYYTMEELDPPAKTRDFKWIKLTEDPQGDGRVSGKSDGKALSYYYESEADKLWFKFDLYNHPNPTDFALNVLIDTDADPSTEANWFAVNKEFKLERMITYWMGIYDGKLQGVNGITDVHGFQNRQWTKLSDGSVDFYLDKTGKADIIGVARQVIAVDLGTFNVIGAVREYTSWNDDVLDSGYGTVKIKQ